jgi:energy-coupling factor transporter ATP-binding protein EcfA2
MFTSIEIKAFRGIRDLTLSDVAPVTLLTGDNGVGKTTVLEAVLALYGRLNPLWVLNLQGHRGFEKLSAVKGPDYTGLFPGFSSFGCARVEGVTEEGGTVAVELEREESSSSLSSTPVVSSEADSTELAGDLLCKAYEGDRLANTASITWTLEGDKGELKVLGRQKHVHNSLLMHPSARMAGAEEEQRFGDAKVAGSAQDMVALLSAMDERIQDVEFVRTSTGEYFIARTPDLAVPLGLLGGGLNNVFRFLVNLGHVRGGWLGIDEIENGIHHSRLRSVFEHLIDNAVSGNTQLMITTHSGEAVRALADVSKARLFSNVAILHLRRESSDQVRATTFRGEDLASAVDLGYEIR